MIKLGTALSLVFVFLLAAVCGTSYVGAYNFGNKMEKQIEAEWTNNKNVLAQYTIKIQEVVQVNDMYKDDLKEVITAALQARYGSDGSKAMFQWIQEHAINFDSGLYTKVQQLIEGGRNKFENSQTKLIDTKRQYETELGSFWRGIWLRVSGYPKVNLDKFNIVTTSSVEQIFSTSNDEPLILRKTRSDK